MNSTSNLKESKLEKENKHLREELERKDQELAQMKKQLKEKDKELKDTQEELGDTQEELKVTQQEVRTRGLLLKSCVNELKTFTEEIENIEKKKHLNHHLICETETSFSFTEEYSYFNPEM
jgi:chromosome segregation ATPase